MSSALDTRAESGHEWELAAPHAWERRGPRGRWIRFVRRYGWRAYALPLLSVLTVLALLRVVPPARAAHDTAAAAERPAVAAHRAPQPSALISSAPASVAPVSAGTVSSAPASPTGSVVEGRDNSASYQPGAAPAPVVISFDGDPTSCAGNAYPQLVLVSVSRQHLWACQKGKQINSAAVTTGATVGDDQTPLGSWRVQAKQRDRYLVGVGYRDYVRYWVPFNGDFGLHDAPWQTMPFGSQDYRERGSHGCVHLPTATMAWLYGWARVGQTVVTIES